MMDLDVDEYGTKVQECLVVVLVGGEGNNRAVVKVNANEDKAVKKAQMKEENVNKIGNLYLQHVMYTYIIISFPTTQRNVDRLRSKA